MAAKTFEGSVCKVCGETTRYKCNHSCVACTRRKQREARERERTTPRPCSECGAVVICMSGKCPDCWNAYQAEIQRIRRRENNFCQRCEILLAKVPTASYNTKLCADCAKEEERYRDKNPVRLLDYEVFVPEYV